MAFTSYLYYLLSGASSRAIRDGPGSTLGEGNGKKHSASVCLQLPLFNSFTLRDVTCLGVRVAKSSVNPCNFVIICTGGWDLKTT